MEDFQAQVSTKLTLLRENMNLAFPLLRKAKIKVLGTRLEHFIISVEVKNSQEKAG
jgi:hypothetical protein